MERKQSNIARDAKDLDVEDRRGLEHLLGRTLGDNERIHVTWTICCGSTMIVDNISIRSRNTRTAAESCK